jgi:DNA-binding GntR family transcriptional regulator
MAKNVPVTDRSSGTATALSPVAGLSRRDAVISEIKRGIVLGVIRPGDKLTEISLSESLGVSRPTVREALNQMSGEGLLIQEPYRGLRVADLEPQAIMDLAEIRVAIDVQAATAILADPTGHRLELLREAWHRYEPTPANPDPLARHEAHIAFHREIWEASGNSFLMSLWPVTEAHMTIALAYDQAARHNPEEARREHQALVEAIESRDRARIRAEFVRHCIGNARYLIELMDEHGDTPTD